MKLVVISYKLCWLSSDSPSGYATRGGFPFQMKALSELFDSTTLIVPCLPAGNREYETPLDGRNLSVIPLALPSGKGFWRKLGLLPWLMRHSYVLLRETLHADACHTPIPGDIGTIGMLLALMLRKPLFVRHCGNWFVQETTAERFWKWSIEQFAGGRNVMLVTGGSDEAPSQRNANIRWIFSTSLTDEQISRYARQRQTISSDAPRLITVCRQQHDKGTDLIIQSLPQLVTDFPGITLDVLGEGPALKEWIALADTLGISHRIKFHGEIVHAQVLGYLHRADIFCFPTSASEGFPKAVLEALACGLPVITTPVSVLPRLIGTGCGLIIQERSSTALAEAVRSLILDVSLYRSMSSQALDTARNYSIERWREMIREQLYLAWGELHSSDY
ncbi:MAG: glycosyltransferase family 4 protein [Anaerolineae bacterium]|nr:glycosyltransferase family 4 protein [Anaerolineae bacterium]